MSFDDSIESRQENEFEALNAIYGDDLKDLRKVGAWNQWQPLNLSIALKPSQGGSGIHEVYAKLNLHVLCTKTYPNTAPEVKLENAKGLSANAIQELHSQLVTKANYLRGEEMIFQLSQHVQDFLHLHNKPTSKSFYDEMLQRQKEQEARMAEAKQAERQSIRQEVQERQEMLKSESKMRRYNSETEPDTPERNGSYDNGFGACALHNSTVLVEFDDRTVQRGRCLKHASNQVVFVAIDQQNGETVVLSQWCFDFRTQSDASNYMKHLASIDQEFNYLRTLKHPNLGRYLAFKYEQNESNFVVYVLQEFIYGSNCAFFMGDNFNTTIQLAKFIAKGVLGALDYLHRNNAVHRHVCDTCIYLNKTGVTLINQSLLRRLDDLNTLTSSNYNKKADIQSFGNFLLTLLCGHCNSPPIIPTTIPPDLYDFLSKCLIKDETQRPTASQLLHHSFFTQNSHETSPKAPPSVGNDPDDDNFELDANSSMIALPLRDSGSKSRLNAEFECVQHLGQGAFGAVYKAKNLLDDRFYAIKCVKLNPKNRNLNRKIVREVKLLSSLDHENVVRYFNSWIESTISDGADSGRSSETIPKVIRKNEFTINDQVEELAPPMKNVSITYDSKSQAVYNLSSSEESSNNSNWNYEVDESDSDGIEFEKSNDLTDLSERSSSPIQLLNFEKRVDYLYIQMEYCDKSTLRSAIDENVYLDDNLVWRLFREIVEGLGYIHEQGMIHRDLKPVNIFLDYDYHVKIGDFGLATCIKQKTNELLISTLKPNRTFDESKTGQIGTALYTAPELTVASKAVYNQKVDIYSLGIIFFEMTHRPFETNMERIKTLTGLRTKEVRFPDDYTSAKHRNLLVWLLEHDFPKRPTCKDLLKSDYVPPPVLEERELRDLIRHTISKPQLKDYKYLIASCFDQAWSPAQDVTYDKDFCSQASLKFLELYDFVKGEIVSVFKMHGGSNLSTPLLIPKSASYNSESTVKLMNHFGGIVALPHDLRVPFARYVASNSVTFLRRYSVERVYREKKVFGFQPRELYECAFDIVTPSQGALFADAEILFIVYEIISRLPALRDKQFKIKLNHASLIRAILLHFDIKERHDAIFALIGDKDFRLRKQQIGEFLIEMGLADNSIVTLINLFSSEFEVGKAANCLQMITRKRVGEASRLAKMALNDLKAIATHAELLGITYEMVIAPGMVYNAQHYSGVICQFVCEIKKKHRDDSMVVLAAGGRYDSMLGAYRKLMDDANMLNRDVNQSAVGVSISLDKIVQAMLKMADLPPHLSTCLDCAICSVGVKPMVREKLKLVSLLWHAEIRAILIEGCNGDEREQCTELKIAHLVMVKETEVRIRSWDAERFRERTCGLGEVVDTMRLVLRAWHENEQQMAPPLARLGIGGPSLASACITKPDRVSGHEANASVVFVTIEKLSANARKRYEVQIRANLDLLFARLSGAIVVLGVSVEGAVIRTITALLEFEPDVAFNRSVEAVIERHPRHKKYLIDICDEICEFKSKKTKPIIVLFSLVDSNHKVII